jgi:hypothetical protein
MRSFAVVAAAVVALLVTACGEQDLSAGQIRKAMPLAASLHIAAPDPTGATGLLAARGPEALAAPVAVAGPSPLAVASYKLATAINGGVIWTLAPIARFTQTVPPTRCDPDACTWGPGGGAADLNVWKLVVAKKGDAFHFTLFGAPRSTGGTAFVGVISGKAWPGAEPNRGYGGFEIDFDSAWAGLDHPASEVRQDFGRLAIIYDVSADLLMLANFYNARNTDDPGDPANPNRVDAAYSVLASAAGGDLQVAWRPLPTGITDKTLALRTRWLTGSGGRADLVATSQGTSGAYSECWAGPPSWSMTWDGLHGSGNEGDCIFPTASPATITFP